MEKIQYVINTACLIRNSGDKKQMENWDEMPEDHKENTFAGSVKQYVITCGQWI